MDAQTLMCRITAAGFTLEVDGEDIAVYPASRLNDAQRAFIRRHKPTLLALLSGAATKPAIPGKLSAPIPPTMRQWDFQRGWWDGETPTNPPTRRYSDA